MNGTPGGATGVLGYTFGPRYDLPLQLATFQWAGAAVVGLSFIFMIYFASQRTGPAAVRYPRREVAVLGWLPGASWLQGIFGVLGLIGLLVVIITGLFGPTQPDRNLSVYVIWVYFWAGTAVLTGLIGPLWDAINPFRVIDRLWSRLRGQARTANELDRLSRFGIWPAVVLFFIFALFEVTGVTTAKPWLMALVAIAYTALTVVGMQAFGARTWLAHVEFFTVLFGILRRFAPIDVREGKVYLRPFGAGLLDKTDTGWDWVAFVILMLSTLAFDAILSTSVWARIESMMRPWWSPFGFTAGRHLLMGVGFIALTAIFLAAFVICMELVIYFGSINVDGLSTATIFALTLVPIAWVYNAAHNYANLVVQSQAVIPLLADPLGRGWHLLPTVGYQPSMWLASAWLVWYLEVVLIISGHVIAMYLAHLRAGERFYTAQGILLSQYPILVLMVVYTMVSLWILAQPITH